MRPPVCSQISWPAGSRAAGDGWAHTTGEAASSRAACLEPPPPPPPEPSPTRLQVRPEVGHVLKLVGKDGVGRLRGAPPRHVHKVAWVRDGHRPQPLHLCAQRLAAGEGRQRGDMFGTAPRSHAGARQMHACSLQRSANKASTCGGPAPHLKHLCLLHRRVVGHGNERPAPGRRGAHGQADPCGPYGALCDQPSGREAALSQGLLNDLKRHPVLHAVPRVQKLSLG